MMLRKIVFVALAALVSVDASASEPLVLLAPDAPPYFTESEDGRLVGRGVDWFRSIALRADIEWRASLEPFNRAVARLANGDADVAVFPTGPRIEALELLRIDEPVRFILVDAYWPRGRAPVRVADDLAGRRVGVMAPMTYGGLLAELDLKPHVATASALGLVRAIERGRVDVILLYRETFAYAVAALLEKIKRVMPLVPLSANPPSD